jgi:hypothetical protein
MNTLNKDEIIQKINKAFSDNEFPGNDNLVAQSYGEEPDLVRDRFTGQNNWNKLTPEFIDFDGALSFFSDKAFRFYIPAFMIADINEQLENNNPYVRLCSFLTPESETKKIAKTWGGGTMGDRAKECFKHFSDEQVNAIIAYLNWKLLQDKNNLIIEQALQNYWLKRTKNNSQNGFRKAV